MRITLPSAAPRLRRRAVALAAATALVVAAAVPVAAGGGDEGNSYTVHKLVSDQPGVALFTDPNLVNGWGIVASATSPWWVSNADTDTSTLYRGDGSIVPLVVSVPGGPTGIVFNASTTAFMVSNGGAPAAARFIWATEDGTIRGWNPAVAATLAVPGATATDGASYKGLAIGSTGTGTFLYAADFHNAKVDVFDSSFALVTPAGSFTDPRMPAGFAPFGIQNLAGQIYVTYAKQDAAAAEEVAGDGLGFVSVFDTSGQFIARVASRGDLNAPWGLALAPAGFGKFSGDLLVGNFGDGQITGHGMRAGGRWEEHGRLLGSDGQPIWIDGLWGIGFGNGAGSGPVTTLYFAAGPDEETHGLFGSITAP